MSTFSFHPPLIQNLKFKIQHLLAFTQPTFIIVLILLSFVILIQHVHAASVTLSWDPNSPAENVVGYRLYYGTESRNYTFMIDLREETIKKVHNLEKGQNYYFAVTAFNEASQESEFSEEIVASTCTYKLLRKKRVFDAAGGVKKIKVRTQANCEWSAQSGENWLRIIEGDDISTGRGFITYSVDPNPTPEKRTAVLTIGGKQFKVVQRGSTLQE
jgi:hypothetical protein